MLNVQPLTPGKFNNTCNNACKHIAGIVDNFDELINKMLHQGSRSSIIFSEGHIYHLKLFRAGGATLNLGVLNYYQNIICFVCMEKK